MLVICSAFVSDCLCSLVIFSFRRFSVMFLCLLRPILRVQTLCFNSIWSRISHQFRVISVKAFYLDPLPVVLTFRAPPSSGSPQSSYTQKWFTTVERWKLLWNCLKTLAFSLGFFYTHTIMLTIYTTSLRISKKYISTRCLTGLFF